MPWYRWWAPTANRKESALVLPARWRAALVFGIAYYVVGRILLWPAAHNTVTDIFWPSPGIALAGFLLIGNSVFVPVAIAAFFVVPGWSHAIPAAVATGLASGGEGFLAAYLLRGRIEPALMVRRIRGVVLFIFLGAVVPTAVAAIACESVHTLLGRHQWHEFWDRVFQWGQADFLGILFLAPLIVAWWPKANWRFRPQRVLESTVLFTGLSIVCLSAFVNWGGLVSWKPLYAYCVVPFMLWATLRLGQKGSLTAGLVIAVFAVWGVVIPGAWLTPLWTWGVLIMVGGVQLVHSASVEEQKDANLEQQRLTSVLAETPVLVVITDPRGAIQYINTAGRKLLGMGADEVVTGLPIMDFHPPEVVDRIRREYIPQAVRDGVWSGESVFVSRQGRNIPALQTILAHKNHNGKIEYLSAIANDLTELKDAQKALNESEKKFQQAQKMESIALLAGGIAHDFNNMLSVILGHVQLLVDDIESDPFNAERLKGISEAANRAASLTRQLLAFSRRQVLQPRVVNLNDTIRDMTNMLRHLLGASIEVRQELPESLGNVNIDPGQMEQIIMNLAINARDAMPKGGTFVLQTANRELDSSISLTGEDVRPGPYVMLAVSDTGIGMDSEILSRIFEPFFTTKPSGKGTGLGLATVYGITKQSGGHIWVYSEPQKGTTFSLYLPRVDKEVVPRNDVHPQDLRGHESVLLVEDEMALRALVADILGRSGYSVMSASPEEALKITARDDLRIDLLLTDMIMPKMSGQKLASRCLQLRPDLKVVYMSGYAPEVLQQQEAFQTTAFVQKPFTARVLLEKIRQVLDAGRAAANKVG